jgi:hypothetical protein
MIRGGQRALLLALVLAAVATVIPGAATETAGFNWRQFAGESILLEAARPVNLFTGGPGLPTGARPMTIWIRES